MNGVSWTPVNQFAGIFDGQNHRIYNLSVSGNAYVGFLRLNKEAVACLKNAVFGSADGETWDGVSNFTHSNSANNYTWYYVGVFAKTQYSATMENVTNFAKVEVAAGSNGKTRIGGICGNWASTGTIKNCYHYGDIVNNATATGQSSNTNTAVATSVLGGVIAQCDEPAVIDGCQNWGTVTNNNPYVKWVAGILASSGQAVTLKNCINHGTIKNTVNAYTSWLGTGGIAGYLSGAGATIDACQSVDASVSTVCHVVGGIAAQLGKGTIQNCIVSNSKITGNKDFPAGILSYNATAGALIKGCKVTNNTVIKGNGEIGGIGGRFNAASAIQNCEFSNSTIDAAGEDAGGIIGWSQNGMTISGCKVDNATISSSTNYVSGVAGLAEKTSVSDCVVKDSKISGAIGVGGFAGFVKNAGDFSFDGCVSQNSAITGKHSVGGIIGYTYSNGASNVTNVNVFNCGTDSATTLRATASDSTPPDGDCMVAGICGWMRLQSTGSFKIVNSYCNAKIVCDQIVNTLSAGGVLGYCSFGSGEAEITNFSSSLTASKILVNELPMTGATRVGALCGMLPDKPITITNCFYIDNLGVGDIGESVVVSDCSALDETTFKDGFTVPDQLNVFSGSYSGYTLKSWTADSAGLPVISE